MKSKRRARPDPVVEEVRKVRARLWKEAGGTPEGLIRLLQERQSRVKTVRARAKRRKPA